MKNITRREAAKAVAIGTVATIVSPGAMADGSPDIEILELERRWQHIMEVELPTLQDAYDDAFQYIRDAVPYQQEPNISLAEIEKMERDMLTVLRGDGLKSKMRRAIFENQYAGLDYKTAVSKHYAHLREAAEKYDAYLAEEKRAEADCGYEQACTRMREAYTRADTICDRIMKAKPHSFIGVTVQLRMIKYKYVDMGSEFPEAWIETVTASADDLVRRVGS